MARRRSVVFLALTAWSFTTPGWAADPTSDDSAWVLPGDADARFRRVAKHFRGFDVAMLEVGHRYNELYWAGRDKNWGYAEYQLTKMRLAVQNGIERRPKRAPSVQVLEGVLPQLHEAIRKQDSAAFSAQFN